MHFFDKFHHPRAGVALLRITLAVLMLLHGYAKLQNGVTGIEGMLGKMGLPAFIAYGVYLGEVVAPILLLVNRLVVPAALVMAINMVVAIGLAHMNHLFALTKSGGWAIELQAFFLVSSIVVALTTPRRSS